MMLDLYTALAIGVACVIICTSDAMQWFRDFVASMSDTPMWYIEWPVKLINCTFCTSVWLSLLAVTTIYPATDAYLIAAWPLLRAGTICALANITILLIHLSMATIGSDE